jgi:hypothetical protein
MMRQQADTDDELPIVMAPTRALTVIDEPFFIFVSLASQPAIAILAFYFRRTLRCR